MSADDPVAAHVRQALSSMPVFRSLQSPKAIENLNSRDITQSGSVK